MSHDAAFAALQSRKRAAEAAGPPRVTWRKVSPLTGGGWSGLGPDGALVWVSDSRLATEADAARGWAFTHLHDYGRVVAGVRVTDGHAINAVTAKRKAAALFGASTVVLSEKQLAALTFLCAGGRSYANAVRSATGAGPNTLNSLAVLGLVTKTTAGSRGTLYHLTESGRVLVCTATANTDPEGGPNMNMTDLIDTPTAEPIAEDAPAPTPAKRRGRGKKDAELATVASTDGEVSPADGAQAKPRASGPSAEMTALYKETVKQVKALARGAKTVEKTKYLRVGDAKGKTMAYIHFPTAKSVLMYVPNKEETSGWTTVSVKTTADITAAVAAVQAGLDRRAAVEAAA